MPKLDLIAPDKLSPAVRDAIEAAPMPGLRDSPKCPDTRNAIERLLSEQSAESSCLSSPAVAGLWLLAGELVRSHTISQSLDSPTGSYWHGIMHRREGDFSNAKYWMRRASGHPVIEELASHIASVAGTASLALLAPQSDQALAARRLTDMESLPNSLIDLCELAVDSKPELVSDLELICWWEWQLLFRHSM
ncbi:MAG: hypothetical protein IT422_18295 [Pirellulaceae bacterium]|jgi:hypothetical protein|nr:hypothetical protein [Pirellulaceae bacterium]